MLDDPHVLALLPLRQPDLLAVRVASRACRLSAETVLAETGIALRLTNTRRAALDVLASPRWKHLRGVALRGVSLRVLCVLGSTLPLALPAPPLPALARLDIAYVDCHPGFLASFPALTDLKLTIDFFVSTYAPALATVCEALSLTRQLRSLEIHGKGVMLTRQYTFDGLRAGMDAVRAAAVASETLQHLVLLGGQAVGMPVDAPLRSATIEDVEDGSTLAATGPRVHAALHTLAWKTPCAGIHALRPFGALTTLDIDVRVTNDRPAEAVRAMGLALPPAIRSLRVALNYAAIDAQHLVVEWPADALAHLRDLRHLYVDVSYPPRGCDVMEEYLWGATAALESVHLVSRETRCHKLREELRVMLEEEEADPDGDDVFDMSVVIASLEWYLRDFVASCGALKDARPTTDVAVGGQWVWFDE